MTPANAKTRIVIYTANFAIDSHSDFLELRTINLTSSDKLLIIELGLFSLNFVRFAPSDFFIVFFT